MSKAEKFIQDYTRNCSNEMCAVEDRFGKKVISYHEWLTPEQALKAVGIAKEEMMANLWKPANGDDLPIFDREVIVLTQPYPLEGNEYAVSFAHRPNPDGWDGKSVTTGKVEHYTPKTYNKGGWNIPNVKYWLDCLMPKEIEL